MEGFRVKVRRASFTVEAVFVMVITIWIVAAICYLSVYAHDRTVLFSLVENYLEQSVEQGKNCDESGLRSGMERYLSEHLMISRIDGVSVDQKLVSVEAEVRFLADVRFPFARRLLPGSRGETVGVSHGVLFAPDAMWDFAVVKDKRRDG